MSVVPWPGGGDSRTLAADSADGRIIMTITPAGEINVLSHRPGAPPNVVRTLANSNFADATSIEVLGESELLIVTHDGRLMRVNTDSSVVEWVFRDRNLSSPEDVGLALAVSPNRRFAAIANEKGTRLYELTIGAPLTPFMPTELQTQELPRLSVANDGAIVIGSNRNAFVRDAPKGTPRSGEDLTCLYGARIVDGRAVAVDIFGDPEARDRCGLNSLPPPAR